MATNPIYRNGEQATIKPAGVLIFFAAEAFGVIDTGCSEEQKQNSQSAVREILRAACLGGYKQCEILETLLSRLDSTPRLGAMASEACAAAGDDVLRQIFDRHGVREGGKVP